MTYDLNGNLLTVSRHSSAKTYTYAANSNKLVGMNGATNQYAYDRDGNMIQSTPQSISAITYDPFTLLTKSIISGSGTVSFEYNGKKERVLKNAGGSSILYLRGLSDYPIEEKHSDGTERRYIYGPAGLIACEIDSVDYYLYKDHLGSTRAVMNGSTGTGVEYYAYDAWGEVMASQVTPDVRYKFTGQEYDVETGLNNFRARMYDSDIGRFYATDPAGQGFSPYGYAGNNPVGNVDPTGRGYKGYAEDLEAYLEAQRKAKEQEYYRWLENEAAAAWRSIGVVHDFWYEDLINEAQVEGDQITYYTYGDYALAQINKGLDYLNNLPFTMPDMDKINQNVFSVPQYTPTVSFEDYVSNLITNELQDYVSHLDVGSSDDGSDQTNEDPQDENYYQNALQYQGVPYLYGGNTQSGWDCSALVDASTNSSLSEEDRWTAQSGNPPPGNWVRVKTDNSSHESFYSGVEQGDLFLWPKGKYDAHTAFYAGNRDGAYSLFHAHGVKGTPSGYTPDASYWLRHNGYPLVYRQVCR